MNIKYVYLLFILYYIVIGCEESLDFYPPDTISENVFWTQEKDAVLAVNSIYRELDGPEFVVYLDGTTDIGYIQHFWHDFYKVGIGTQDPTDADIEEVWSRYYKGIRKANDLLMNIDLIENADPDLINRIKGEAIVLRSYFYTNLISLWGDVPLITDPEGIKEQIEKTPKGEIISFILSELDKVIEKEWLPVAYEGSNIGRITKGAALALKARVCLRNNLWRETADATQAVIDLEIYDLHSNYGELFTYSGENSSEIILSKQYTQGGLEYSVSAFSWGPASIGGGANPEPTRKLFEKFEHKDRYNPENPYASIDPRWGYTFYYPGSIIGNESSGDLVYNSLPYESNISSDNVNAHGSSSHGWNLRKYIDYEQDKSNPAIGAIDMILIRYADILLMYAESKIELDEIDNSVYDAINQVRVRVGIPPIKMNMTQLELRTIVRNERVVEFAFEGLRLYDVKRWQIGEEKNGLIQGIEYRDKKTGEIKIWDLGIKRIFEPSIDYRWPIPQREIDLNRNVDQNIGY